MEVVLTRPQMKGIYLSRSNIQDQKSRYKRSQIREHVVKYIHQCHYQNQELKDDQLPQQKKREIEIIKPPPTSLKGKKGEKTESQREMAQKNSMKTAKMPSQPFILDKEEATRRQHQNRLVQQSTMIKLIQKADEAWIS